MFFSSKTFIVFSSLVIGNQAFAGGPLVLEGSDGNTPVNYLNPSITVHVETGKLGLLDNSAAYDLMREAFDLWNTVSTTTINLGINTTLITEDIDLSNFEDYLPAVDDSEFHADDNLNPIVYDDDGQIIDAYFGVGQSDSTIGFAASILTIGASHFDEGYAVINGKDLGRTTTELKLLITHEIGHFVGLDHTQVNINNQETDFGSPRICSTAASLDYPVMYPFVCRDVETLHSDDIAAISALYPVATINNSFGIVQGFFISENGFPILGANIWAENLATGDTYSIVSDYLKEGTGFFKLLLPAGNYTLHANSINTLFNGGSGIGPYSLSISDASFQTPHPIVPVAYQGPVEGAIESINITTNNTADIEFIAFGTIATASTSADNSILTNPASPGNSDSDILDILGSLNHNYLLLLTALLLSTRHRKILMIKKLNDQAMR